MAEYPLPDGVEDAVFSLAQLATAMDVSTTTVADWVRQGVPVKRKGGNGRSYEFQFSDVWAWRQEALAEDRKRREEADALALQNRLKLVGGETRDPRMKLTARERRDELEVEASYNKLAAQRRELIPTIKVAEGVEALFLKFRAIMDALPDRLGDRCGLDRRGQEEAQAVCDEGLAELRRMVEALDFGGNSDGSGPRA